MQIKTTHQLHGNNIYLKKFEVGKSSTCIKKKKKSFGVEQIIRTIFKNK